jgi:hypothetical protein
MKKSSSRLHRAAGSAGYSKEITYNDGNPI